MKRGFKYFMIFGLILSMVLIQFSNNPAKAVPTTNNTWVYSTGVEITCTAISEDGQYIVAASNNIVYLLHRSSPIPLWNYTTGEDVFSVDLSADGQYIVAGIGNVTYLFHRSSSTPLWANETGGPGLASAAISADGEYIVAGSIMPYNLYFFHRNSSIALWTYDLISIPAAILAISAHGETCVIGQVSVIRPFRKDGSNCSISVGSVIRTVAVSADGYWCVAGCENGRVQISNYLGGEVNVLQMGDMIHSVDVSNSIISYHDPYLVAGDDTGNFTLCTFPPSGTLVMWFCILPSSLHFGVRNVAISADGQYIAATNVLTDQVFTFHTNVAGFSCNVTSLWNYTLTNSATTSKGLAMSADGRYVATGTSDGNLYFCDLFDSDGDDLADGYEEDTSPTDPYLSDTDGDGLNDSAELFLYPTNATDPDTDDDGLTDGAELLTYFTNATNPDTDGDGYSDGAEVAAGSDPLDPESVPSEGIPGFELAFVLLAGVIILFQNRFHKKQKPFAGSEFLKRSSIPTAFSEHFRFSEFF